MAFNLPLLHSKHYISNPSRKYLPLLSSSSLHISPPILHLLHHHPTQISALHRLSSCTNFAFPPPITTRIVNKCFSQRQSTQQQDEEEIKEEEEEEEGEYNFERLFSNLNQATLKREPGSLSSAIFLVAGTTVGAGILAIPAVTQEAGFLASAVICILCWLFMVVSGLLIAEVNVKTMCELGSGGVSLSYLFILLKPLEHSRRLRRSVEQLTSSPELIKTDMELETGRMIGNGRAHGILYLLEDQLFEALQASSYVALQ